MNGSIRLLVLSAILIVSLILGPITPAYAATVSAQINQTFTPIAIVSGGTSRLRVTIFNLNVNQLTSAAWSDNLVLLTNPGLSIASTPGVTQDCGGTVTAVADSTTLALSGGTVPGKTGGGNPGSCFVEVSVTSTTPGNLINHIPAGALSSFTIDGGIPVSVSNNSDSEATLNVTAVQPPSLSKSFSPNTIQVGGNSQLTIAIRNNDATNPLTETSLTDALPTGLVLGTPVQHGSTPILAGCGAGTLAASPGGTTVALSNATIAKNSNCVIVVDVTSETQGAYTNTIPAGSDTPGASIHTREGVTNASPAGAPLNVQALTLSKSFGTSPIAAGDVSQMTITINNVANLPYTGVSLIDTLPAGDNLEYVAGSGSTTCGGTITITTVAPATAANTLNLSGGSMSASASCTITVNVRARANAAPATYTNTIPVGALTTSEGAKNDAPTSANLEVQSLFISKAFLPTTFAAGQTSILTITIHNPSSQAFSGASLSDTLPTSPNSNLRFTGTPTTTCGTFLNPGIVALTGSPTRTVNLTGGTVSGGSIASPGKCTITGTVTTDANAPAASYTGGNANTIPAGALHTTDGGTNASPATAGVSVTTLSVAKGFSPTSISAGQTSTLTITITNPAGGAALTGLHLTDTLPTGLQVSGTPAASQCNGGSVTSTSSSVTLTGGSLAAGPSSCTVVALVTATGSASAGTYTNTISPGALTTTEGPTNSNTASVGLGVQAVSVVKAFSPTGFQSGGQSALTITLRNPTNADYTGVNLTDTLPSGLSIAASPAPIDNCGGTLTAASGTQLIQLVGGTIPLSASPPTVNTCTLVIPVTGTSPGDYTNRILQGDLTTTQGPKNVGDSTALLSVYITGNGMTATKTFTPATINIGGNSDLRLTFTAPPDVALTGFTFTDTLPTGVTISNSSAATNTCGGTLVAATGASTISIGSPGGSIGIGATCTVHVFVTSNIGSGPGVAYTNTINHVDIGDDQGRSIPVAISKTLTVQTPSALTISKAFFPTVVNPGGLSTLQIILSNTNAAALVNVTLTDGLPDSTTDGVVVAPIPNASTTCGSGAITAVSGTQSISMTNGTIPAQVNSVPGLCAINVDVQGKSSSGTTPATHHNLIHKTDVTGTIQGTASTMNALGDAAASLTVQNLTLEAVKSFDPVLVYGGTISKLSVRLRNPNSSAELSGISFTDNMPANQIILVDPPGFDPSDCGPAATMSGSPGTSTFSFGGGYLAPGAECTLTLNVTMIVNDNKINTIPSLAVSSFNGAKNQTPTAATLTNLAGASVSKSFAPGLINAGLGNYSMLTITIRTTATVSLSVLGLVDNLPPGLQVAGGSAPLATNGCGGTLAATPGAITLQLSGGSLPVGPSSCNITAPVTGATAGLYTNTIPAGTLTDTEGQSNHDPAVDTLTLLGVSITKAFGVTDIPSGGHTSLMLTITNPNSGPAVLTSSLTDTLPSGMTINTAGNIGTCAGVTANAHAGSFTMDSGTSIPTGGCTIIVDVTSSTVGTATNTIPAGSLHTTGGDNLIDATAGLNVHASGLLVTKTVDTATYASPTVIDLGYSVTVRNIGPDPLTAVQVVDDLTVAFPAPATFTPAPTAVGTSCPGTSSFSANSSYDGKPVSAGGNPNLLNPAGLLASGDTCTITVLVQVNTAGANPNYTNTANAIGTPPLGPPVVGSASVTWPSSSGSEPGGGDRGGGGNRRGGEGGSVMPRTGFAPGVITSLPPQPSNLYAASSGVTLEIPTLGIKTSIVGVPQAGNTWDVTWLGKDVGYLAGTAFPTWSGNSVLTGHVYLANGLPGPFINVHTLKWGDQVIVHLAGQKYVFQVRENRVLSPDDASFIRHRDVSWLTLITCKDYTAATNTYAHRVAVAAVLVKIEADSTTEPNTSTP